MSLKKLSELTRQAEKELKDLGFTYFSIKKILSGERVTLSADSEAEAQEMVNKYKDAGLRAEAWTSSGNHGYPDSEKVTVGL